MKKINLILGALVCLFAFSACTEEVEYTPASPESAKGVYFPSTLPAQVDLTTDATSFDVQIWRTDTVGEQTVDLNVVTSDTTGIFTFPSSVTFADGATAATITIAYNLEKMSYGQYTDITLSVDDSQASAYGGKAYAFTAGIPEPWTSLGVGTYYDYMFFDEPLEAEIQQSLLDPAMFRVVKPYHELFGEPFENTGEYLVFTILEQGKPLGDVTITQEDLVYFDPFNTGYVNGDYGEVWLYHPVYFTSFGNDEANFVYSKVLGYQQNNLPAQVQLAPMYFMPDAGGAYDYTKKDNTVLITFPGVVLLDYSVGVEYLGRYTAVDESVYADLGVTMGPDVASVKVAMALTEDVNAVLAGVLDGSLNPVELTQAGTARFAMAQPGKYSAVAVSYDADGNAQEADYTQFEYAAAGAVAWKSLGMAQYTDGLICSLFNVAPQTYAVEIQENEDQPGLYRLVNPYGEAYPYNEPGDWDASKDYYLEINAEDPQGVYMPTQSLGFDWGYGMFSATSMAAYQMENGGYSLADVKAAGLCGTLNAGVITFPTQGLLLTAPQLGNWYYANVEYDANDEPIPGSGNFKVVLPSSASKSSKSVKAVVNKTVADKKNISGKKLKKMDKQLPKNFQLKK